MKKHLGFVAGVVCLLSSGAAMGADINGSLKDSGDVFAPKSVNWTGFYVGGRIGYGHANHDLTIEEYKNTADAVCTGGTLNSAGTDCATVGTFVADNDSSTNGNQPACVGGTLNYQKNACTAPGNFSRAIEGYTEELFGLNGLDSSGVTGGGQLGFDLQRGRFVFGVFGSYDLSGMETTVSVEGTEIKAIEKGDEWSLGARAGLLVNPRTLLYVLAAYTESEFTFAGIGSDGGSKDITFSGVTVGSGVEFALTQNVFLGIEGTHTFYGEETLFDTADPDRGARNYRAHDEIGETKVMGTLKIKLNGGLSDLAD